MSKQPQFSHNYLVDGAYQLQYPDGVSSGKQYANEIVTAKSEVQAIVEVANKSMANGNYRQFTWLYVSAKRLDTVH